MGTIKGSLMGYIDRDIYRHLLEAPLMAYSLIPQKERVMKSVPTDPNLPIIFVHGLGGNRSHFLPMSWYLKLNGRKSVYRVELTSGTSVRRMAWQLAQYIRKVVRVTGKPQVEIVAHSLGGIIARLAIGNHEMESLVKTLITLGTPHQGTYSARYVDSKLSNELRPNSALIRELRNSGWPKGVRGVSCWSENDLFVLPAESALMEGTQSVEVSPFTHFSYLCNPKSWEIVRSCLEPQPSQENLREPFSKTAG